MIYLIHQVEHIKILKSKLRGRDKLMSISITRGLVELKTLNDRISKATHETSYINVVTGNKVVVGFKSNEEYEKDINSKFQSVVDLIARRDKIKSAIVKSNALTEVEIAGVKITVAEAIDRKASIEYKRILAAKLKADYGRVLQAYEREEQSVKVRLDELLKTTYGKDAKVVNDQYEATSKPFLEQNQPKLIDPLEIKKKYEKLEQEVEDFLENVDFVLSESNAITQIDVD